mgnify:CR=1 FL=1
MVGQLLDRPFEEMVKERSWLVEAIEVGEHDLIRDDDQSILLAADPPKARVVFQKSIHLALGQ